MNTYTYDFKDQSPIRFEFFQSDMEKMQFMVGEAIKLLAEHGHTELARQFIHIRDDIEHKIQVHIDRGEWK